MFSHNKIYLFIFLIIFCTAIHGMQYPRPLAGEPRIKVMNYDSNAIHYYTGFYGYQSSIVFDLNETISTISMGDSTGWQLIPQGNRLFLKPITSAAETNATIITNMRIYHFEMHAKESDSMSNADLAYELRFLYSENNNPSMNYATTIIPDIADNDNNLNFNYSISGSDKIAPIMAFDDGEFTYLKFRNINVEMPAIFDVDARGNESIINYKSVDDYIVIERVSSLFTLRAGNEITCLFNENIPFIKEEVRKRKKGILQRNKNKV